MALSRVSAVQGSVSKLLMPVRDALLTLSFLVRASIRLLGSCLGLVHAGVGFFRTAFRLFDALVMAGKIILRLLSR